MYLKFIEKDPSLPLSWEIYFKSLGEELSSVVKELEGQEVGILILFQEEVQLPVLEEEILF